jgi:Tol biopolymer transport system component
VVRWTPDSRAVVFTSRSDTQPERLLCDVATGTVTKLTLAAEQVTEIVVSPGGKEIAYIGGPAEKDEGVWLLENFLPPAKKQGTRSVQDSFKNARSGVRPWAAPRTASVPVL